MLAFNWGYYTVKYIIILLAATLLTGVLMVEEYILIFQIILSYRITIFSIIKHIREGLSTRIDTALILLKMIAYIIKPTMAALCFYTIALEPLNRILL